MLILRERIKRTIKCTYFFDSGEGYTETCKGGKIYYPKAYGNQGQMNCKHCKGNGGLIVTFEVELQVNVAGWNHYVNMPLFIMARGANHIRDIAPESVLLDRALDAYLQGPGHVLRDTTVTEVDSDD